MLFFSTPSLACVLVLFSTLTSFVLATGPRTLCVMTYDVAQGETCASIEQKNGVGQSLIESINPGVDCNNALTAGTSLCMKQYTPICTLNDTATSADCTPLTTKWNISASKFIQYNDNVNNCTDITTGDCYCVSIDGCYPGNTDPLCEQ